MKLAAKILSTLFHPLLIPLIGLLILFNTNTYINYSTPKELKQFIIMLIIMSTLIIPLLIALFLLNKGFITSLQMESQKERRLPYMFTIICYMFTLYMLTTIPIQSIIFKFFIGATISVIIAFILNLKWKVSAHMIGIGGLVGALFYMAIYLETNMTLYIITAILVAGLVGSARLILKAHNAMQVYLGFMVGVMCQAAVFIK